MKKETTIEKNGLWVSVVLATVVVIITMFLRYSKVSKQIVPISGYAYYVEQSLTQSLNLTLSTLGNAILFINAVILIFGLGLFYLFVKKLIGVRVAIFSSTILCVSAPFLYNIILISKMPLSFLLSLIALMFFMEIKLSKEKYGGYLFGLLLSSIALLFIDPSSIILIYTIILMVLLHTEYQIRKQKQKQELRDKNKGLRYGLLGMGVIFFILAILNVQKQKILLYLTNIQTIEGLNGDVGIGAILIIMTIVGYFQVVYTKKDPLKNMCIAAVLILGMIITHMQGILILTTTAMYAIVAGILVKDLEKKKWSLENQKFLTLLLIFCIFLFSLISYVNGIRELEPTQEEVRIEHMLNSFDQEGKIWADTKQAYFWGDDNEIFPTAKIMTQSPTIQEEMKNAMALRNLEKFETYIEQNNITTIVIPKDIEDNEFWTEDAQRGMLFIIENSKHFKKVYTTQKYNIWHYKAME